jgi:hypothetical protein
MKKNIQHIVLFTLCFLGIQQVSYAQELDVSLDISPAGSSVYDVIEVEDDYLVVGRFTQLDGENCASSIFLDQDLTPLGTGMVTTVNGNIYAAEFKQVGSFQFIFLGGDFTTINGQPRNYFAVFGKHFSQTDYVLRTNDIDLIGSSGISEIRSLALMSDTLMIGGSFNTVNAGTTNDIRYNVAAFRLTSNLTMTLIADFSSYISQVQEVMGGQTYGEGITDIAITANGVYLAGIGLWPNGFQKLNNNLTVDVGFNAATQGSFNDGYTISALGDSLIYAGYRWAGATANPNNDFMEQSNGALSTAIILNPFPSNAGFHTAVYKDKLFYYEGTLLNGFDLPSGVRSFNPTFNTQANVRVYHQLHVAHNRLFVSAPTLTTMNGFTRMRFAAFCMEPSNATIFSGGPSAVCAGQTSITYSVAPVDDATEYIWEYTGSGALLSGQADSLYAGDTIITGNSISLDFDDNFLPGTLRVTPRSSCQLTSNTIAFDLVGRTLPNVSNHPDTTLTCFIDTITLVGSSLTANTTFTWFDPLQVPYANDSLEAARAGTYLFRVVDMFACRAQDTVVVSFDTAAPLANSIPLPWDLSCADTTRIFTGSSVNPLDSTGWVDLGSGTYNVLGNPLTVTVPGTYQLIVMDRVNGCADSAQAIVVSYHNIPPNLFIVEDAGYSPVIPLDTISCYQPSVTYTCASDSLNAEVYWTTIDSSANLGTALTITQSGTYYIAAVDSISGCSVYKPVVILADTARPNVLVPSNTNVNCSSDSVTLDGSSGVGNAVLLWTGPSLPATPDPVTVIAQGWYTLTATKPDNGCSISDSVEVSYTPEITVDLGNDIIACDATAIDIASVYIGTNVTSVTYLWSNGETDSIATFVSGIDSLVVVEIFGSNSCYGTDTIQISTPDEPLVTLTPFAPCGATNAGSISITAIGGLPPFSYSINNGTTYQTSTLFSGLSLGNYGIILRDSLGCEYDHYTAISDSSQLPSPQFLVGTYHAIGDTVVLVDVSNPPADSTSWIYPPNVVVIDSNTISPVIIVTDTGSFDITLQAFYGSCMADTTKTIYVGEFDTTFATSQNMNGIESVVLYPNPNAGTFTIDLTLYKKQQVVITVQDMTGYAYHFSQYGEVDFVSENIVLPYSAVNGTYVLKLISEYDSAYIQFIISR